MKDKILKVISKILAAEVTEGMTLDGISSLKMLQVIMALDDEGIKIPLDKVANLKSVADICAVAQENR